MDPQNNCTQKNSLRGICAQCTGSVACCTVSRHSHRRPAWHGGSRLPSSAGVRHILQVEQLSEAKLREAKILLRSLAREPRFVRRTNAKEREILHRRLLGGVLLREIAVKYGVRREEVRQLEATISKRFRRYLLQQGYLSKDGTLTGKARRASADQMWRRAVQRGRRRRHYPSTAW